MEVVLTAASDGGWCVMELLDRMVTVHVGDERGTTESSVVLEVGWRLSHVRGGARVWRHLWAEQRTLAAM